MSEIYGQEERMKMSLSWRLKDLPKIDEVEGLIKAGIITKEEAREIFFKDSEKTSTSDDLEDIKKELEIIRKLVTNSGVTTIIKEIQSVPQVYRVRPWYEPYNVLCSNLGTTTAGYAGTSSTGTNLSIN